MDITLFYIWGSIGAAFFLFVGALIGHAIYDRQQMIANALQREHLEAVESTWRRLLNNANDALCVEYNVVRELEISLLRAGQALEDENMAVFDLELRLSNAYDPTVNQKAKNLYVKGVRAGAKKGRAQMQKSIDNQAVSITNMYDTLAAAHMREDIYREAVSNTLNDKVGLVGVRRAIVQGIAAECARLRAVEAKKGE